MLKRAVLLAVILAVSGGASVVGGGVAVAWGGQWMQDSCANPDGSSAPSEGWSASLQGGIPYASTESVQCSSSSPMQALLTAPAAVSTSETLAYQPPAGSS